jgi:hypothetical protein
MDAFYATEMEAARRTAPSFAGRHACDSPEWYTPEPFVEAARAVMGGIDLDPASHAEANRIVNATTYFTERTNGLLHPWFGRVFLNPPGGLVNEFWKKLAGARDIDQAIWIGYSLEQLQTLQHADADSTPIDWPMCVLNRRIAFIENEAKKALRIQKLLANGEAPGASAAARKVAAAIRAGKEPPNSPSHGNYITYLGPHVDEFVRVFSDFGQVRA